MEEVKMNSLVRYNKPQMADILGGSSKSSDGDIGGNNANAAPSYRRDSARLQLKQNSAYFT